MRVWAYAIALGLIAAVGIRLETIRNPRFDLDGYTYAIQAQVDKGIPYAAAREAARSVYRERLPALASQFNGAYPRWWALFQPRVVYPWLAAQLWPLARFNSLFLVSNAAYAISVALLYLLFLEFAPPGTAALLAVALALSPDYRQMGRSDLTDMTAFAFWCAALLGIIRFARFGDVLSFVVCAVATILMCSTRPIPYLPLVAVMALGAFGAAHRNRALVSRAGALFLITVVASLPPLSIALLAHAPGFSAMLAAERALSPTPLDSLGHWYWHQVALTFAIATAAFATSVLGPIALAAFLATIKQVESWMLLGVLLSFIVSILLDPFADIVHRAVLLPILPAVGCGLALALRFDSGSLLRRSRPQRRARDRTLELVI
jgi:hypothetical protein